MDTGVGIPASKLHAIFEPGVEVSTTGTAFEKGTGLGLLLCADFARLSGGSLGVESTPGTGSTFTLRLPSA